MHQVDAALRAGEIASQRFEKVHLVNCSDKAAVQNYEEAFYGAQACVETAVIDDAAHVLNLHHNAEAAYHRMLAWADRNVGRTARTPPLPCGTP